MDKTNTPVGAPKRDTSGAELIPLIDYNSIANKLENADANETSKVTKRYSFSDGQSHTKDKDQKEKSEKEDQLIGFFSLFKYCSSCEKTVIILASIIAAASGITLPGLLFIYGFTIDEMAQHSKKMSTENCTYNYTAVCSQITEYFLHQTALQVMWMACLGIFCMITLYSSVVIFHWVAAKQAFKIRCMFMASVLRKNIGWYDTNQTGDFAHKITGDLILVQEGMGDKVAIFIRTISSLILSISFSIYCGWKLALVSLAVTPVLIFVISILSQKQAAFAKEEMAAYSNAGAVAEEIFSAIRTVAAFGGEKKEIERYGRFLTPAMNKEIKRAFFAGIGIALSYSSILFYYCVGFLYGVHLLFEDWGQENPTYTTGRIASVIFNVLSASVYLGQITTFLEAFGLATAAASKIFEIIDQKTLIDSCSDSGVKPLSLDGNISLNSVHFRYPARPDVRILKEVNLNASPGETVALVGPSGCGKSTIIQLILRFYDTDSGDVAVDGNNVKDLNVGWLRDHISLVGQEPVLFSTTIEANIMHGKTGASPEEVEKAAKLANAHDFIESLPLKYKTLVGERGIQLSGGQKQRIAIARAVIKNPKILLLDEATSALDTESETVVQAALEKASLGRTTIVVAHRLSTIRNADKIVVINQGKVQEVGTHDELIEKRGKYYDLVRAQTTEGNKKKEELNNCEEYSETYEEQKKAFSFEAQTPDEDLLNELDLKRSVTKTESEEEDKYFSSQTRLLKLFAQDWPYIVPGSISAMLNGVYLVYIGILFGNTVGLLKQDKDEIEAKYTFFCILFLVLAFSYFVLNFLQDFMFAAAGGKFTCRLRKMVFASILKQDISFFDYEQNSVGSLCSRLSSDVSDIQGAAGSRISLGIQCISAITSAVILSFWYSYKIALVALPFIPLVSLAFYAEARVIATHMNDEKASAEEATKIAVEAIGSIRTVASLHQEEALCTQFRNALYGPYKKSVVKSHVRGLMQCAGQSIIMFYYAAAFYCGSRLVADGELLYEDLLKVLEGVFFCVYFVGLGIGFAPEYQKGKLAAVRIFKLLDLKTKIDAFSEEGQFLEDADGNIRFQDVHFSYPSRPDQQVLKGLSFEVESGKTVALVGSSGCGKSTCVQLIERLYDVNFGKVMMAGVPVEEINIANLRSHIGLVSQEPVLFSRSIAENIAYGDNTRTPDQNEVISAARQANIHSFITSLPQGYDTYVGDKGTLLSCGQKQRIAIARALLRKPKLLLLDEATSALDTESEKVVQEALEQARQGKTCLIIAHRLSTVQNADTIIVMHNGKVAEKGTHEELLRLKGLYYNIQNILK